MRVRRCSAALCGGTRPVRAALEAKRRGKRESSSSCRGRSGGRSGYSLSHDAKLKGAPEGFVFPVREVRLAAGAGFVVAYAGTIMTMPGLGRTPAFKQVDIDENGEILGLF